jgi:A nuclease family of the HNH/ENDO VII superfamily with conserved AHH
MSLLGNSSKDSKYLRRIKTAIALDPTHPRHHGVKMQAHHVISGEGMKRSGLGKKIEQFGYDINLLPNLSFIPCTLQGACYLGVQPHRGNHTALVDQDSYDDDNEPTNYHKMVSAKLKKLDLPLSKECPGDKKTKSEDVRDKLDKLSKDILGLIQNKPGEAPLTDIARSFTANNPAGCCGVDSVPHHKGVVPCPVGRNHLGKQSPGQKNESITYKTDGKYKLKPGQ